MTATRSSHEPKPPGPSLYLAHSGPVRSAHCVPQRVQHQSLPSASIRNLRAATTAVMLSCCHAVMLLLRTRHLAISMYLIHGGNKQNGDNEGDELALF